MTACFFSFVLSAVCVRRAASFCGCLAFGAALQAAAPQPNILFIAVDDLRSQLGCYGDPEMKTPNIDQLAQDAVLFEHHYTTNPICIPSRAGMLTGTRSERTRQVYGKALWPNVPGIQTLGATFDDAGYHTVSLGKIWHQQAGDDNGGEHFDVKWSPSKTFDYADPVNKALAEQGDNSVLPAAEGPLDVPDEAYVDGLLAERAVQELAAAAATGKPFLLMTGFHKPHLPFNAPKKYWDLYEPEAPPGAPELTTMPEGSPAIAARKDHELWTYEDGFTYENPPGGAAANRLRQAYAACVSYSDAQIGKLLAELDRLGLRDTTIIVLWSDHGYQLGHLAQWTKHTNYENAANSPLLISAPGFREGARRSPLPVESCDLFPTLLDLCGLPPLAITDGASLRPLLVDPAGPDWTRVAYHLVDRYEDIGGGKKRTVIGRAVRDRRFRYIEWHNGWENTGAPRWVELYDFAPGAPGETRSVADDPALVEDRARLHDALWDWESQASTNVAPTMTTHPVSQDIRIGQPVTFTAVASGEPAPTYQWFKGDDPLTDGADGNLTIVRVAAHDAGVYSVIAANASGTAPGTPATLTALMSFDGWRAEQFTAPGELDDPEISGLYAIGADGVANGLKYALGLSRDEPVPAASLQTVDATWRFTFQRPTDRTDILYAVESSLGLIDWIPAGELECLVDGSSWQTWGVTVPAEEERLFFRLKIEPEIFP